MFLMKYFISLPNLVFSSENAQVFCYAAVLSVKILFSLITIINSVNHVCGAGYHTTLMHVKCTVCRKMPIANSNNHSWI